MVENWAKGDIYVDAVAAVLGIEPQAVTRDQRELAKVLTFGARFVFLVEKDCAPGASHHVGKRLGGGIKPRTEEEIRRDMRELLVCFRPGLLFAGEKKTNA